MGVRGSAPASARMYIRAMLAFSPPLAARASGPAGAVPGGRVVGFARAEDAAFRLPFLLISVHTLGCTIIFAWVSHTTPKFPSKRGLGVNGDTQSLYGLMKLQYFRFQNISNRLEHLRQSIRILHCILNLVWPHASALYPTTNIFRCWC